MNYRHSDIACEFLFVLHHSKQENENLGKTLKNAKKKKKKKKTGWNQLHIILASSYFTYPCPLFASIFVIDSLNRFLL